MTDLPAWKSLPGLSGLAALQPERHGLRWLGLAEGARYGERLAARYRETPPGTLWPGESLAQSRALARNKLAVLAGPRHPGIEREGVDEGVWYVDPAAPGTLQYAESEATAPILWHEVSSEAAVVGALADAIRDYEAEPERARGDAQAPPYPRHLRAVMGRVKELQVPDATGALVVADPPALGRYWTESPYRPDESMQLMLTRFSRSLVRCELHGTPGLYVWDMSYRPAPHAPVIARLNALFDTEAPDDLPLDAYACALGFRFDSERQLLRYLAAAEDAHAAGDAGRTAVGTIAYCVEGVGALRHGSPELGPFLAHFAAHPEAAVRLAVAGTYFGQALRDEFESLRSREEHPELRAQLDRLTVPEEARVIPHAFG